MPKDENEIGALWLKERDGKKWMSGKINGQNVVIFRNMQKKTDKHPDYRVLLSKPREAQSESPKQDEPF